MKKLNNRGKDLRFMLKYAISDRLVPADNKANRTKAADNDWI